jgi:hypothetical protein
MNDIEGFRRVDPGPLWKKAGNVAYHLTDLPTGSAQLIAPEPRDKESLK